MKNFKNLYGFGGHCLKIRDIWECIDFEPYFKVHKLVPFHPKSIIQVLGQMFYKCSTSADGLS